MFDSETTLTFAQNKVLRLLQVADNAFSYQRLQQYWSLMQHVAEAVHPSFLVVVPHETALPAHYATVVAYAGRN